MSIGIIFFWVTLSVIVGYVATQSERGFGGFFFLSLIVSPLISLLVLIALPAPVLVVSPNQKKMRKCLFCAELIKPEAIKCKHCGSEVDKAPDVELVVEQEGNKCSVPNEEKTIVSCPSCQQEESVQHPRNSDYYTKFKAKESLFSFDMKLNCKECGNNFIYKE